MQYTSISTVQYTVVYTVGGTGGGTVTVTAEGGGRGTAGTVTVTAGGGGTVTEISHVTIGPSSKSSSFSCRTYATNYFNGIGLNGKVRKRGIFDREVLQGGEAAMARPGARPGAMMVE